MKRHVFTILVAKPGVSPLDICEGCGLTWNEISDQLEDEDKSFLEIEKDDCDLRLRKQKIGKAFW